LKVALYIFSQFYQSVTQMGLLAAQTLKKVVEINFFQVTFDPQE
jgi:hypothetical protein